MICLTTEPTICLTLVKPAEMRGFQGRMVTPTGLPQARDCGHLVCPTHPESGEKSLRDPIGLPNLFLLAEIARLNQQVPA